MSSESRAGRPKASSRETLAEAACELFLEKGFEATSIADITTRAGVSRSSFFNYFASKSDVLWAALDDRIALLEQRLAFTDGAPAAADVRTAVAAIAVGFAPDSLALALVNATAMGLEDELEREASVRRSRIARAVADRLRRGGAERIDSEVAASAWAGAVLAALEAWAHDGPGRTSLVRFFARATVTADAVTAAAGGAVRQLRVVVQAPDFDTAVAFYRDAVGMPQAEAYEADGGARVVILDAGRATLELANPEQVAFIDRVETGGDAPSDRIRIALEVDDTPAVAARLTDAGAELEASPRLTPWRSLNARLRGAAGLQLTLFQELGPR
ncbi:TetR family transcriptional regulator [Microbacterium pumilum]|uniref:TetR family transcriptional regulator n=1 Tax=Microbacterium pumilum TaxID=344165 RepID=A0ABP5E705_9MICO